MQNISAKIRKETALSVHFSTLLQYSTRNHSSLEKEIKGKHVGKEEAEASLFADDNDCVHSDTKASARKL